METQKVVLVTGASQGLGKALCEELLRQGYKVFGVARSEKTDQNFSYLQCDVSNEHSVAELSKKVNPDVIICAAGIHEKDNYNPDLIRKTMEINYFGTMHFVTYFKNTKQFISISSTSAFRPNKSVSYSASKAAIGMSFRSLAMNSNDKKFSTVYLGPVNTEMWEGRKSWIVVEPDYAAKKIIALIKNPKPIAYIPFVSTTLLRISLLIPDWLFTKIGNFLFK